MTLSFDVIVCGSLHLDIMIRAPRLPGLDETAVGSHWAPRCGGKGGNQARQSAAAGARVAMIGRVGPDDFGQRLRTDLAAGGVNSAEVATDSAIGSGMSVAIVTDTGDYGAVIVSGANLLIDPDAIGAAWRRLGGARLLLLQNEVPEAVNLASARAARGAGAAVVLNAAPARGLSEELLGLVDVLVVNRVEAAQLSGRVVDGRADAEVALPLLGGDQRAVIITLGGEGLVLGEPGRPPVFVAAEPVTVVSTHGAGDCFVGTLAARLTRGDALGVACRVASAAAARHVSS